MMKIILILSLFVVASQSFDDKHQHYAPSKFEKTEVATNQAHSKTAVDGLSEDEATEAEDVPQELHHRQRRFLGALRRVFSRGGTRTAGRTSTRIRQRVNRLRDSINRRISPRTRKITKHVGRTASSAAELAFMIQTIRELDEMKTYYEQILEQSQRDVELLADALNDTLAQRDALEMRIQELERYQRLPLDPDLKERVTEMTTEAENHKEILQSNADQITTTIENVRNTQDEAKDQMESIDELLERLNTTVSQMEEERQN